jgi:hypothetical protein
MLIYLAHIEEYNIRDHIKLSHSLNLVYKLPESGAQILIKRIYRNYVRFEVFTAVTIKNGVFLDVT